MTDRLTTLTDAIDSAMLDRADFEVTMQDYAAIKEPKT